jgi:hypothetical protein
MRNFIKRLWLRRWFRGCTWAAITLFTVLILVRQYIGWSGARRWAAAQEMLAREGESLDFHTILSDPVPDHQNFCAIPPLKDLPLIRANNDDKSEQGLKRMRLVNAALPDSNGKAGPTPKLLQGPSFGTATDMKAWADWLRKDGSLPAPADSGNPARDVLAALSGNDALVSELALGLSRPESQWTPAWKTRDLPEPLFTILLPHYGAARKLTSMLCLRSAAAARAGDAAKAHESLRIALRLNQANMDEPFLIGTLVGCAESGAVSGAVWELCDAHSGTTEDFRALQEELSRLDYHASLLYGVRGELAACANDLSYLKRTRDASIIQLLVSGQFMQPIGNGVIASALRVIPDGWYDANAAAIAQWLLDYGIEPLRDAGFKELLAKQKELQALVSEHQSQSYRHPGEILARLAMPANWTVSCRVVYAQSLVNEAIAACALERYRIEHNTYPDALEAANRPGEKSIPPDVISGKPMGYRKTPDGRYALWCFGLDGTDHGGKRVLDEKNPESTKFYDPNYSGDWVWDFPAQ